MIRHAELFAALCAPFEAHEVKARQGQRGATLHYITARTAMNRLDSVLGPNNWRDEYRETKDGLLCRLWYRLPDEQEWLWKEDGGGFADMADADDAEKSAFSSSFKRAAAKLGVARYLYRDGVPSYAAEATPPSNGHTPPRGQTGARAGGAHAGAPGSGRGMFAWCKEMEQKRPDCDVLRYVSRWGKMNEFPDRMVEWTPEQVRAGYEEACRKLGIGVEDQGGARASAPESPAPRRDAGDAVLQRANLSHLVGVLHEARSGTKSRPSPQQFYEVLDDISKEAGEDRIDDFGSFDDVRILGRLLATASNMAAEAESKF